MLPVIFVLMLQGSVETGNMNIEDGSFITSVGKERTVELLDKPRSQDDHINKRVKVKWEAEDGAWYEGKISGKTEKGRYKIDYDDGDVRLLCAVCCHNANFSSIFKYFMRCVCVSRWNVTAFNRKIMGSLSKACLSPVTTNTRYHLMKERRMRKTMRTYIQRKTNKIKQRMLSQNSNGETKMVKRMENTTTHNTALCCYSNGCMLRLSHVRLALLCVTEHVLFD